MKKIFLALLILFLFIPKAVYAQSAYEITSFSSSISLQKNTDLLVNEKITVNFNEPRHGIFRYIPIKQRSGLRNITTRIFNVSIKDNNGNRIPFSQSKKGNNIEFKIGDPDKYVSNDQIYNIEYTISNVVQKYENYDEVYWNVVGSGWDTTISNPNFYLTSDFADIDSAVCYTGDVGSKKANCEIKKDEKNVSVSSNENVLPGQDFTVVVTFYKNNYLQFPGIMKQIQNFVMDNWLYPLAALPLFISLWFWYKKGRDITYGEKLYYGEESNLKYAPVFARPHLPTVYRPIEGLTPAQIGTLIDETVNLKDIIGEIVELARLGYIKIKQVKKDYDLTYTEKDTSKLRDYQKYLLEGLFPVDGEKTINTKNFKDIKFYKHLDTIKAKIYESITIDNKYFDGNPDMVRKKWALVVIFMMGVLAFIYGVTGKFESNPYYIVVLFISVAVSMFIASRMPRKTAKGYALYRDSLGLKNYLKIGKWRAEIYEKNLFIEEMIPIAISLGIVDKLAKQMRELGIKAPSYFSTSAGVINLHSFEKSMTKSVMAGAPNSSKNSWSGGSGISGGGFSGGGFGGGGGGSW